MGTTYSRFLGTALLALVALALVAAPDTGFAKAKKGKKADDAAAKAAPAPEDDVQVKAREHYSKGKELYEAQNYADAMVEFQAAYDLKPHPTVLKSVAECKLQIGDIPGAIDAFERVLSDPATTKKDEAKARLDEVKAMMASLEVASTPEGAGIVLDGTPTEKVTPASFDLVPGDHELALNLEGWEPLVKNVTLGTGEKKKLDADFAAEGVSTAAPEPTLADPFAEEGGGGDDVVLGDDKDGPPPAFWISAAVAGVGLVAGTVFGTMALGDEDDYKANPNNDTKEAGERNAIIADVSFGVAAAAAIVGIVILATNKKKGETEAEASTAKWQVVPVATGETFGVSSAIAF